MKYISLYVENGFGFSSLDYYYYYDKGNSVELGNIDKMYILYNTTLWTIEDNDVYYSKSSDDIISSYINFDNCMKRSIRVLIDNGYFEEKNVIVDHVFNLNSESELKALEVITPYLSKIKGWE